MAAAPILIVAATRQGDAAFIAGAAIFAATMVLLYLASTIYHALPLNRAKRLFNVLDHSAIYLLIAGTYTPSRWALRALGLDVVRPGLGPGPAGRGAEGQQAAEPPRHFHRAVPGHGLAGADRRQPADRARARGRAVVASGRRPGTGGVVFFVFDSRWRYAHFVWHLFVLAGTACHFFAVLWYARVDIPEALTRFPRGHASGPRRSPEALTRPQGHACGPAKPAPRHPAEAAPPACYGGS